MTSPDVWSKLDGLPRRSLAVFPTPLTEASRVSKVLGGPELWIKRDDLISFGFGGNKVRGLELLLADAERQGRDVLVTGAGAQSNHVRATAAAAAMAGMKMVAVLWGTEPTSDAGNFRLTRLLGAEPRFTGSDDRSSVDEWIQKVSEQIEAEGHHPYPIPRGGACALGVLGHALAARELSAQWPGRGAAPLRVLLAGGSGGTYTGWLLGNAWLGRPFSVDVVTVSRPVDELAARVLELAESACQLLGVPCPIRGDEIRIHGGFIGEGYGVPTREGSEAIALMARTEGVFIDPTYTGKAFAWYAANATSLAGGPFVFIHSGGEPTLFAGAGAWVDQTLMVRGDKRR